MDLEEKTVANEEETPDVPENIALQIDDLQAENVLVACLLQSGEAISRIQSLYRDSGGREWCVSRDNQFLLDLILWFADQFGTEHAPSRTWLISQVREEAEQEKGEAIALADGEERERLIEEKEAWVDNLGFLIDLRQKQSVTPEEAPVWAGQLRGFQTNRKTLLLVQESFRLLKEGRTQDALSLMGTQSALLSHDPAQSDYLVSDFWSEESEDVSLYKDRRDHPENFRGIRSGICILDEYTGGMMPGEMGIIASTSGNGKAQPVKTPILTPSGWKAIGTLQVGDQVIGSNGKPCRVIGVHPQGIKPVYRVEMSDKSATECCGDHLWFTQAWEESQRREPGRVRNTNEIAKTLRARWDVVRLNHRIPVVQPIWFESEWKEDTLPINPYLLGVLLGDGGLTGSSVLISNSESDIQNRIICCLPEEDTLSDVKARGAYRVRRKSKRNGCISKTKEELKKMGLWGLKSCDKFIPEAYLRASIGSRIELLHGLMDTDGCICPPGQRGEFSTSSPRMALNFMDLVRSLGGTISVREKEPFYTYNGEKKVGKTSYRMFIYFSNSICPVSSVKHLKNWRRKQTPYYRKIASVTPAGEKECVCISVDALDQLYVTEDYILTHNSFLSRDVAVYGATQGKRICIVAAEQYKQEVRDLLNSRITGIPYLRFKVGNLSDLELQEFVERRRRAKEEIPGEIVILDVPENCSVATVKGILAERALGSFDLFVWDHLGLMNTRNVKGDSMDWKVQAAIANEVREFSRSMKNPAGTKGVVSWVVCQVNSSDMKKGPEKIQGDNLSLAKYSGWGSAATVHIYRDYQMEQQEEAILMLSKVRGGPRTTIHVRTNLACAQFLYQQQGDPNWITDDDEGSL